MINTTTLLLMSLAKLSPELLKQDAVRDYLLSAGFCVVGSIIYDRPTIYIGGVAYAPTEANWKEHTGNLAKKIALAKRHTASGETESVVVSESLASVACPQMHNGKPCGGALNRRGVCPSCVTGKMGYKYRYTCESCGCDIVTKEELK